MSEFGRRDQSGYDVAEVCMNGHPTTGAIGRAPEFRKPFCEKCGEPTITICPACKTRIQGEYFVPGVISFFSYTPPAYCHQCGAAFPWTDRAITAAIEMAVEAGGLSADDQKTFSESVNEIARDSPKATVAGSRIVRLLAKMGKGTAEALRDILVDVASESAKKIIWPDK